MTISLAILKDIMSMQWWAISVMTILLIIAFLINIILYRQLNRRMKHFEASSLTLQKFMSGQPLDVLFKDCFQKLADQEQTFKVIDKKLSQVEMKLRAGVDRAEILRFKAFENVGGDLSFAVALLNQEGNGVVLSSIHNRDESRVYAKPISEGMSTYSLTSEEKVVIERAMLGQKI